MPGGGDERRERQLHHWQVGALEVRVEFAVLSRAFDDGKDERATLAS
jgi:hypothetical protein